MRLTRRDTLALAAAVGAGSAGVAAGDEGDSAPEGTGYGEGLYGAGLYHDPAALEDPGDDGEDDDGSGGGISLPSPSPSPPDDDPEDENDTDQDGGPDVEDPEPSDPPADNESDSNDTDGEPDELEDDPEGDDQEDADGTPGFGPIATIGAGAAGAYTYSRLTDHDTDDDTQ